MQIAMITVPREPMYLYDSLHSLLASLEGQHGLSSSHAAPNTIDLFIGLPQPRTVSDQSAEFAGVLQIDDGLRAHGLDAVKPLVMSELMWQLVEPLPPKLRAVGNFCAALNSGEGDLMLFEDDIAVKPGWLRAIDEILTETIWPLPDTGDLFVDDLFVSLYSRHDIIAPALFRKPIRDFYGTLGLYVPEKHRYTLAEAALQHLLPDDPRPVDQRWPFDEIVKGYINDHPDCQLIETAPSYVDHRGDVSIINPTHGPRRAPTF